MSTQNPLPKDTQQYTLTKFFTFLHLKNGTKTRVGSILQIAGSMSGHNKDCA